MADIPLGERRFTDREVREILKKAVEQAPSQALTKADGLSLEDLQAVGEEVGIEPARLEEAARSVVQRGGDWPSRLIGGPTLLNFERKVEGTFDLKDTPEVLARIRRILGRKGDAREVHGSLEWSETGEGGERLITLSSRDGETTIRSSANLSGIAALTYLPAGLFGTFVSMLAFIRFVKAGSEVALIVCVTVLMVMAMVYPLLRKAFGKLASSEAAKLEAVVEDLGRLTENSEV